MIKRRHFKTSDGVKLATFLYEPTITSPRGSVLHIHGYNEHAGRYERHWSTVAARGYRVLSFDLRHHGRSEGQRCFFPPLARWVQDIFEIVEAHQDFLQGPPLLLGHSFGGVLAGHALLNGLTAKAVTFSSPALAPGVAIPHWGRATSPFLNKILPHFSVPPVYREDALTTLPSEQERFKRDPFCQECFTARSYMSIFGAGRDLLSRASELRLPTCLIYGEQDRISDPVVLKSFSEQLGASEKLILPDHLSRHELFFDLHADRILGWVVDWMDKLTLH